MIKKLIIIFALILFPVAVYGGLLVSFTIIINDEKGKCRWLDERDELQSDWRHISSTDQLSLKQKDLSGYMSYTEIASDQDGKIICESLGYKYKKKKEWSWEGVKLLLLLSGVLFCVTLIVFVHLKSIAHSKKIKLKDLLGLLLYSPLIIILIIIGIYVLMLIINLVLF